MFVPDFVTLLKISLKCASGQEEIVQLGNVSMGFGRHGMYLCVYNLFKVGKFYKDSKLYLQDIQSLIKTDDTGIK